MTMPGTDEGREPGGVEPGLAETATSADGGLVTFFQPFYNLRSHGMQGLEALVRRRRPDGGTELAAGILDTAREAGVMRDVDRWVLDDALGHLAHWHHDGGRRELILSINVSAEFVGHPDVCTDVATVMERHRLGGDRLLLDVTVDIFRTLDEAALERLGRLQEREIGLCLDGFGPQDVDLLPRAASGPIDIVKLHPTTIAADVEWLSQVASAAQDIGMPVVAAGVETPEQLDTVTELGFEWAQGFLLGRPVEADRALDPSVGPTWR